MTQPLPKLDATVELTTAQIYRPFPAPEPMNPITAEPQDLEPVPDALLPGEKKPKAGRPKGSKSKPKKARAKKAPAAKAPADETVPESPAIDVQRLVASAPTPPHWAKRYVRADNAVALLVALLIFAGGFFFAATIRGV